MVRLSVLASLLPFVSGFLVHPLANSAHHGPGFQSPTRLAESSSASSAEVSFDLPPSGSGLQVNMKIQSVLSVPSEIVVVRYKVPFGLDVAPKNSLAVCNKDGEGGEKVGDVLRYTSQWTMGLPQGDGIVATAASFSGGISWQCTMFNVMNARSWEEVVEALTSNVESRTDEVVMLFERALEEAPELK